MKRKGIDEQLGEFEKFVGLAKEAATKPLPRADEDIAYYLGLAAREGGKAVDAKTTSAVWELFQSTQRERIKRVEAAIKRYEKSTQRDAHAQLAWYTQELARLKEWKAKR